MLDTIHAAILEGGRNVFLTLPKLTSEEILSIWDTVSGFVEKQLSMNKGVLIPGLGTFSFLRQKFEVGASQPRIVQRPVFLLSEKLAQIHGLKLNKIHTPGDIPVVHLNFIVLSLEGPFNRETVEGCVRETLLSFSRSIATKQTVEFTFKGIGVLVVRDNRVKMKFYKDFLQAMDGSGNLVKALSNRPGTGDSVLSGRNISSPQSRCSSVVMFPRIEAKEMETITEESEKPGKEKAQTEEENSWMDERIAGLFITVTEVEPDQLLRACMLLFISPCGYPEKPHTPTDKLHFVFSRQPTPVPEFLKTEQETSAAPVPVPRPRTPSPICQDHGRAGQEMCYLCLQRAQRSIPLQLSEERRKKEKEEDRILAQYQAIKDQEALQKQLMRDMMSREQSQKIAAFNLGVAEAIRSHKNEKSPDAYKSCIFEKRPPSSTPHEKQEAYAQQLEKQLSDKAAREMKEKQDQDLIERLELMQLAEELAAQRAKFLKDRMEEKQCYKRALDTQIKMKPAPLPEYVPDSAQVIFGKNDMSNEIMEERRKRAREYYKYQLQAAADHRRAAILSQLVDQRKAADMIQRARKQWMAEKGARIEKIFQMNVALQENWRKSAEMKRQRDYEEKLFQHAGDKLLLLDQCEKYRRCYQCKRGINGCGEPSAWTDTKYVPGSRLVV
ncbi:coiled-coil domain-containing protein 81 [Sceloporus undulatus]|uniref:coiled-coil domain-containing protein 81 n=1 Tax=Sceloporus undulatus TaxID=8520 RepID=UPI001C4AA634|nr:coiled-coil domain-containing protein 81 [Sceloporus undulatus]